MQHHHHCSNTNTSDDNTSDDNTSDYNKCLDKDTIIICPNNNNSMQEHLDNLICACFLVFCLFSAMTDTSNGVEAEAPEQPAPLSYPRDFFRNDTHNNPTDELTAAALLWQYRRDRPPWGTVDTQPADGAAMLREIGAMRERFRKSVLRQFMDDARQVAREVDLRMICGNRPVTPKDLKSALSALENNPINHQLAYRVCHEFHRQRTWLANAIDNWFLQENMVLLPDANPARIRHYESSRGSFGDVARQAKAQALAKLMQPIFQKQGWYIATTNNSRTSDKLKYVETVYNDDNNGAVHFYVVTKNQGAVIVSGGNESFTNRTGLVNDNEDDERQVVEVNSFDFPAMASILTQHFGITASAYALKSAFQQTAVARANLTGTTMLLVQNDESMTTMTSVDNNCSMTIKNPAVEDLGLNQREASGNETDDILNEATLLDLEAIENTSYSTIQQCEIPALSEMIQQLPTIHEATDSGPTNAQPSTTVQPTTAEPRPSTIYPQNNNSQLSTTVQPPTEPTFNLYQPNNNTRSETCTEPQIACLDRAQITVANVSTIFWHGFCCYHHDYYIFTPLNV